MQLFGGIEAGGTKFICAIGTASGEIKEQILIPTRTPAETMPEVIDFFQATHQKTPLSAIGIGSFGPVDPDPNSPHYGSITTTPKLAWAHFNVLQALKKEFDIPMGFDTDVNSAALGEYRWGAGQGLHTFMYITIGTGIGAGAMVEGQLLHGLMHPEMGHILVPHDREKDPFDGVCPFHGNCLEGLASGPSINKRWNVPASLDLPDDHMAWDIESDYLAAALANYTMLLSPQRIIMGGGVMKQPGLIERIRPKVIQYLSGYIQHDAILNDIDRYIVAPGLGGQAGICGAIALGLDVVANSRI